MSQKIGNIYLSYMQKMTDLGVLHILIVNVFNFDAVV